MNKRFHMTYATWTHSHLSQNFSSIEEAQWFFVTHADHLKSWQIWDYERNRMVYLSADYPETKHLREILQAYRAFMDLVEPF